MRSHTLRTFVINRLDHIRQKAKVVLEIAASITSVYSLQLTISSHALLSDTSLILSVKEGLGKFLTHSSRDASSGIGS